MEAHHSLGYHHHHEMMKSKILKEARETNNGTAALDFRRDICWLVQRSAWQDHTVLKGKEDQEIYSSQ